MTLPDFHTFHEALHGRAPFAWQSRAATELAERGWWPALTAPTGAGKTTLIEAWLHALAVAGPERLGRRLFWVVDRRAVIDQVFDHAVAVIGRLLEDGAPRELAAVVARLREIGGGATPVCGLWRGGLDESAGREARQALDPSRVACVCSTIDQIGSRLLFRGYGIAPGSRAIHAGLAGIDAAIVLDEAHIATDLRATAGAVASYQSRAPRSPAPPLRIVEVTATPRDASGFTLTAQERTEHTIARRIDARKRVQLTKRGAPRDAVAAARKLAGGRSDMAVGIILNTVADARAAFDGLTAEGIPETDRTLVIGPVRPLDRQAVLARIPPRDARVDCERPFFVVATQTIEVGVDLDLDALVTACAPVPSLVQRLGRLDRVGAVGDTHAVVLAPPRGGCPVYGEATDDAFRWLEERLAGGELDLGPAAIERLRAGAPWPQPPAPRPTPVLQEGHVEALTRTGSSEPEVPEVSIFLHGDREMSPDVGLLWRADLAPEDGDERVADRLGLRPPQAGETLSVSLPAAARWLSGAEPGVVADIPSADDDSGRRTIRRDPPAAWIVRRSGHESPEVAHVVLEVSRVRAGGRGAPRMQPGDTIVLPSSVGGADGFGWAPASAGPVSDLGSLHPARPRIVFDGAAESAPADVARVHEALEGGELTATAAARALARHVRSALPGGSAYAGAVAVAADQLSDGVAEPLSEGQILVTAREQGNAARTRPRAVTLDGHQRAVAGRVAEITAALALGPDMTADLALAARHHDEGKRDPRFQAWLSAGNVVAEPLAKSSYVATGSRVRALREAAGWPQRKRHEVASALLLNEALPEAALAYWLVATHHGANRPFPLAVGDPGGAELQLVADVDGSAVSVTASTELDLAQHLDAFERLSADHGPWGLAYLEAVLIFADREVSGAGG